MRQITRLTIYSILLCFICCRCIAQTVIKLEKEDRGYITSCSVNGLKIKLEIATDATEVGISQVEASFMFKNGYIKKEDMLDSRYYETASGEIAEGAEVILRKIDISGMVLTDIKAIVIGSETAPLLIGQNALTKLGRVTIDYNHNTLTFLDGPKKGLAKDPENPHGIDNDNVETVHVEGGNFSMGSDEGKDEEMPKHNVYVRNFCLGKYEVTVGQFREFVEATGYRTTAENEGTASYKRDGKWSRQKGLNWRYNSYGFLHKTSEDHEPVLYTSWYDAQRFCEWLSSTTSKHYRLPTEAEWEYAAKGGNKGKMYKYSGSSDIDEVGWVLANTGGQVRNAGLKKPNELGIYDMTGNVLEYCSDWFDDHYYRYSPVNNPKGPDGGKQKVARGGSVISENVDSRNTDRHWDEPTSRCNYNGFRVAMDN